MQQDPLIAFKLDSMVGKVGAKNDTTKPQLLEMLMQVQMILTNDR